MTPPITFFVSGDPKGQPRPRAFAFHGKARVYDPGTAEGWKSQIALAAREHVPAKPIEGALQVRLTFFFKRPKSHFRKIKGEESQRTDAPFYHTQKPDADNVAKAVLDCLTTLGFWKDDAQVAILYVSKMFGNGGVSIDISQIQ